MSPSRTVARGPSRADRRARSAEPRARQQHRPPAPFPRSANWPVRASQQQFGCPEAARGVSSETVDIERLTRDPADERAVREWHDVVVAAFKVDLPADPPPTYREHRAFLEWTYSADPAQTWIRRDASGRVVGGYRLALPEQDNEHTALLDIWVHPDDRRRGHGHALWQHAADRARQAGRELFVGEVVDGSPGAEFVVAHGGELALRAVRRILDLRTPTPALPTPPGDDFEIVAWTDDTPKEYAPGVARLYEQMADAPVEALDWRPENWDVTRLRRCEQLRAEAGLRVQFCVARHGATGHLVGLTEVFVNVETPRRAYQGVTVVLPAHRGHGLGLRLKSAMRRRLEMLEPASVEVVTDNAGSNEHMIRVNEALGYHVLDVWHEWQARL